MKLRIRHGQVARRRVGERLRFSEADFVYDPLTDTYRCSAGKRLHKKSLHRQRQSIDYSAAKSDCAACALRSHCTENASGRTIKRHLRQEDLDQMRARSRCAWARLDQRMRQHLMERSFARSIRYGFDRARWRGLWRVQIQEYLICALQNIQTLIRYGSSPKRRPAMWLRLQVDWDQLFHSTSWILLPDLPFF